MKKLWIALILVLISVAGILGYSLFGIQLTEEVVFNTTQETTLEEFIETSITPDQWESGLSWAGIIRNFKTISPGKYKLSAGLTPWKAIVLLRQGDNSVLLIRSDEYRTIEGFCKSLSNELSFLQEDYLKAFTQLAPLPIATTFVFADTYDFRYSESPEKIAQRFKKIHDEFWNAERVDKAKKLNLTPEEVYILASMVKGETKHFEEAKIIAGLYLNRLKVPMKMQCDATVKFANEDWEGQRITQSESKVNSPYNTYDVDGLPPGPIFITEKKYIDAVLNADQNNFIYMCAKDDGSGYHWFTNDSRQHINYANRYHRYLDRMNIKE
jgi:UPF0755 protein